MYAENLNQYHQTVCFIHLQLLPTALVVPVDQSVRCVRVCVSRQQLLNQITFDPDIWHTGSS